MESGFSQEAAARMVNSALILNGREGMFSTVDICAVDLYTGICEFLNAEQQLLLSGEIIG